MSLESWKQEFYPTEADSPLARDNPVGHSLRKWKGLTRENLGKHSIGQITKARIGPLPSTCPEQCLVIDSSTCALCKVYYKDLSDDHTVTRDSWFSSPECDACSIKKLTGASCHSPYASFITMSDPNPMIELLTRVQENQPA